MQYLTQPLNLLIPVVEVSREAARQLAELANTRAFGPFENVDTACVCLEIRTAIAEAIEAEEDFVEIELTHDTCGLYAFGIEANSLAMAHNLARNEIESRLRFHRSIPYIEILHITD